MNTLKGKIIHILSSDLISLVSIDVEGDIFSSLILEGRTGGVKYTQGDCVNIVFKETEVGIAKGMSGLISFRNRFRGRIKMAERGEVISRIVLEYKEHLIDSVITTRSAEEMDLQINDEVLWLVKSNEISLWKMRHDG